MLSGGKRHPLAGTGPILICSVICCLLWGSAFPCIKIGYRLFAIGGSDTASQILFAGCRFSLAGVLVILAGSALKRRWLWPKRSALKPIALLSLSQTAVQYLLFYIGLAHASGVNSSIINGANAAVTIVMACFVFRCEPFSSRKLVGCLLGFGGILLLNISGGALTFAWSGEGFVFLSTVAAAVSSILIRRFSQDEDPVMLSGWQFLFGGLLLALCGLLFGGKLAPSGMGAMGLLGYLAFLSAAAYTLWSLLLQANPVSAVSVYKCLNPLFGALLSAWLLGESAQLLRWQTPAALALVVLGVLWTNWSPRKKA
ncbi:MAG: DMT family transporter [Clostridia bacterium]|nr:DMT family transporter [Clostridia bacterium]